MSNLRRSRRRLCLTPAPADRLDRRLPSPLRMRPRGVPSKDQAPGVLLVSPPHSYRLAAYVEAARSLGCKPFVASEGHHSLVPDVAQGIHVELTSAHGVGQMVAAGRNLGLHGVVATDDAVVEPAGRVAMELGLRHNSPRSARLSRRKDLAREALADAVAGVPEFRCLDLQRPLARQIAGVPFPCVVKPVAMSGSRGVIRADDGQALVAACERIRPLIADLPDPIERTRVLVEDFMPGREVAVEAMLDDGTLTILAMFDKPDPLDGPYFEETYYITPSRLAPALQRRIRQLVVATCRAYGLREGPIHAELRVRDGDARVIEVAARTIGGQCARLLRFGTGLSLEALVIAHAVGLPLAWQPSRNAGGVLMIPTPRAGILRRVEGVLAASRVPYVEEVEISIREGYELVPLPEGSSYLGFIFARAPNPALAERALRDAHACLNIVTAPMWTLSRSPA